MIVNFCDIYYNLAKGYMFKYLCNPKKDKELLDKYYTPEGKVKENLRGDVLPLGGLYPIMTPRGQDAYSLVASHRIVGIATVDNLGIVEVYLTYQDGKFVPYQIVV